MNEHTKGLLRVGHSGAVVADHPVPEMSGSDAVEYYGGHLVAESVTAANARRLAACWNLLDGYDTEELEGVSLAEFVAKRAYLNEMTTNDGLNISILNAKGDSLRRRWEGNFAGASAPLVLNVLLDHLQRCSAARARKVRA